jgi:cytoskeletal protein CcmA (bactofilin family)
MLGNFGSRALDNGHDAPAARPARTIDTPVPTPRPAAAQPAPRPEAAAPQPATRPEMALRPEPAVRPETVSSIGSGMSITGNITCDGPMQVYGRIEGELRATEVLVGDSAQVEGNIVAQELTIRGSVKGTIRAVRVKLQGKGTVEGDIYHRSLSVEENALFEGSSRRVENPMESGTAGAAPASAPSSSAELRGVLKQNLQALAQLSPDTADAEA